MHDFLPNIDPVPAPRSSRPVSISGSREAVPLKWEPSANSAEPEIHRKENRYIPTAKKQNWSPHKSVTRCQKFLTKMDADLQKFPSLSMRNPNTSTTTILLMGRTSKCVKHAPKAFTRQEVPARDNLRP